MLRLNETCAALVSSKEERYLKADHFLHLRCELSCPNLVELVEPLMDHTLTRLVSVMDHTPGQRQFADVEAGRSFYAKKYQMRDEEFDAFVAERLHCHHTHSAPNRRTIVRQAQQRCLKLASHDDATAAHVDEAIADEISIAEFPTTAEAAKASHQAGLAVLMGGPNIVRGKSHTGNASARDFAAAGWLDIVSSDYVPASLLFATLVLSNTVDSIELHEAVRMATVNPAEQAGLTDRGELAEGLRADLVRFHRGEAGPVIREVWRKGRRIA